MVNLSKKEIVLLVLSPPLFLIYWYIKWVLKHKID